MLQQREFNREFHFERLKRPRSGEKSDQSLKHEVSNKKSIEKLKKCNIISAKIHFVRKLSLQIWWIHDIFRKRSWKCAQFYYKIQTHVSSYNSKEST